MRSSLPLTGTVYLPSTARTPPMPNQGDARILMPDTASNGYFLAEVYAQGSWHPLWLGNLKKAFRCIRGRENSAALVISTMHLLAAYLASYAGQDADLATTKAHVAVGCYCLRGRADREFENLLDKAADALLNVIAEPA